MPVFMLKARNKKATSQPIRRKQSSRLGRIWWFRACFLAVAIGLGLPTLMFWPSSEYSWQLSGTALNNILEWEETESAQIEDGMILAKYNRIPKGDKEKVLPTWSQEVSVLSKLNKKESLTTVSDDTVDWRHYDPNRTIALVHIGKAGGLTLRQSTSLGCRLSRIGRNSTEEQLQPCINAKFASNATLSRQVSSYFHMHGHRPKQLEAATSFLFVLRHPVDRVISSFRYSHPANCRGRLRVGPYKPWGCNLKQQSQEKGRAEHRIYSLCFPSAGMEDFAQNAIGPFPEFNTSHFKALATAVVRNETARGCRKRANDLLRGNGPVRPNPHMYYNYAYYMNKSIRKYPTKEVFGVRTDHEWEDIRALDVAIGGAGDFEQAGRHVSHGSENYLPSPLTTEAYHKLCCVLEQEIANYQEVLQRVLNLNQTVKDECMEKVRQSCGIMTSFEEWRQECKARMEKDRSFLERNIIALGSKKRIKLSDVKDLRARLGKKIKESHVPLDNTSHKKVASVDTGIGNDVKDLRNHSDIPNLKMFLKHSNA